jgi:hypothetical protein
MWPTATHDEAPGRRHGLLAMLFGWAWPSAFDRGFKRFWKTSWLWSWMWPGRVMGPDGEVCALAPWHPAARAVVLPDDPWQRKISKHGGVVFMMFAASAIAAPTFMEGMGGLDGGRLNLFRGGNDAADQGAGAQGGGNAGGQGAGGGNSGGGQGGSGGPGGGQPGGQGPNGSGDQGGGDGGGEGGGDAGPTTPGGDTPGDGLTFLDPPTTPGSDSTGGFGFGGGDGGDSFGGGGLGGGGGGGSGGGGGQPTDPTTPTGPTDPTNPGGTDPTNPGGGNPPGPFNPPNPPTDKPNLPVDLGGGDPDPGKPNEFVKPTPPVGGDEHNTSPVDDPGHTAPIPEPATWAMMLVGFGAVGYLIRRRRIAASVS